MQYKNLSDDAKTLYKRAYALELTEWHWTAARILSAVHGREHALTFLEACGGDTAQESLERIPHVA